MVNKAFSDDIKKHLSKKSVSSEHAPGEVGRRYEPTLGVKKHNERIHRESKIQDKHGNLDFKFSKPDFGKVKGKNAVKICNNCNTYVYVKEPSIHAICYLKCKCYSKLPDATFDSASITRY